MQSALRQAPASPGRPALLLGAGGWLGAALLSQLLADSERPLRSVVRARVVVAAVRLLADQPSSVRVLTQEPASHAAQAPQGIEPALREGWKLRQSC